LIELAVLSREEPVRCLPTLLCDHTALGSKLGEPPAEAFQQHRSEQVTAPLSRAFSDDDPKYGWLAVGPSASNPSLGVKPPVTSEDISNDRRTRQALMAREFQKFLDCKEEVPVEFARLCVVDTYLNLRPEELSEVRWSDVDFDAEELRVRRAFDIRESEEIDTKTIAGKRDVPIHPNLMPLLKAMHEERASDDDLIVPRQARKTIERYADLTRRYLRVAGVDRASLFDGEAKHKRLDFRSWRTTGLTWLAMLGTDSHVMALQAGHEKPDVLGELHQARARPAPEAWRTVPEDAGAASPPVDVAGADRQCGRVRPAVPQCIGTEVGTEQRRRRDRREKRSGEGGIRTRGRLLTDARLASGYLRPLGHLSEGTGRSTAPGAAAQLDGSRC
jgi:integrase